METKFGWMEMWNHFIGGGAGVGVGDACQSHPPRRAAATALGSISGCLYVPYMLV